MSGHLLFAVTPEGARERALLIAQQDADAPKLTDRMDAESMRVLVASYDALRLALAACEAREMALQDALEECVNHFDNRADVDDGPDGQPVPNREMRMQQLCETALSAPRDSGALRAFGERCAEAGQKDAFDEMSAMDAGVPRKQQDSAAIVARILSGGAA